MRPLIMKMRVAISSSQGTSIMKVADGVMSRTQAPSRPPTTPVTVSGTITRRDKLRNSLRYAQTLAGWPGHSATVLVALALTGGMPANNSDGKETKLPPPATELMAPAATAATKRRGPCATCIKNENRYYQPRTQNAKDNV